MGDANDVGFDLNECIIANALTDTALVPISRLVFTNVA